MPAGANRGPRGGIAVAQEETTIGAVVTAIATSAVAIWKWVESRGAKAKEQAAVEEREKARREKQEANQKRLDEKDRREHYEGVIEQLEVVIRQHEQMFENIYGKLDGALKQADIAQKGHTRCEVELAAERQRAAQLDQRMQALERKIAELENRRGPTAPGAGG